MRANRSNSLFRLNLTAQFLYKKFKKIIKLVIKAMLRYQFCSPIYTEGLHKMSKKRVFTLLTLQSGFPSLKKSSLSHMQWRRPPQTGYFRSTYTDRDPCIPSVKRNGGQTDGRVPSHHMQPNTCASLSATAPPDPNLPSLSNLLQCKSVYHIFPT